jgi:hypothetical protein
MVVFYYNAYMPRFLYSVVLAGIVFTACVIYGLLYKSPENQINVLIFICFLFLSFTSWLSLGIYIFSSRNIVLEKEQKKEYQRALKKALFISLYVLGIVVLRFLQLLSPITGILYSVMYFFGNYLRRKFF